jgi:hypothetical protein
MAHKPLTHKLTRDQLYALVWQSPVATLAKQFGVSGRGLGKISPAPARSRPATRLRGQKGCRSCTLTINPWLCR